MVLAFFGLGMAEKAFNSWEIGVSIFNNVEDASASMAIQ